MRFSFIPRHIFPVHNYNLVKPQCIKIYKMQITSNRKNNSAAGLFLVSKTNLCLCDTDTLITEQSSTYVPVVLRKI